MPGVITKYLPNMHIDAKKIKIVKLIGIVLSIFYFVFFLWAMHFSIHPEAGYEGSYIAKLPVFELMLLVGIYILMGQYLYCRCIVTDTISRNWWSIFLNSLWSIVGAFLVFFGVFGL